MNLEQYQELSGQTVPTSQEAWVKAQIKRSRVKLESLLGFTLLKKRVDENLYNELGKTSTECSCPSVDTEDLEDPDDVQYAYRLFRYNEKDDFLMVDPFTEVYAVKLVHDGVTVRTFDPKEIMTQYGRDGIAKYIKLCKDQWCLCSQWCSCNTCLQLAVDAKWLGEDCLPTDLKYLWADMVQYEADCKKNVKSETVLGHSYTKFGQEDPITISSNLITIRRYAGPYSPLMEMPTE